MPEESKNPAEKIPWIKQRGRRLLDLIVILLVCFFGFIAWQLMQHPEPANFVLLAVVGYVAGRIIYELAFNRTKIPTLETGFFERRKIVECLKDDFQKRGGAYTMIDLGSGRGELTRQIARALPQAQVIGFEIAYFPYLQSRFLQRLFRLKNLEYRRENFMTFDCAGVQAVMLYLNARLAKEVGEKLQRELKPGALVISHSFLLGGAWQPVEILSVHTPFKVEMFVYRKGA